MSSPSASKTFRQMFCRTEQCLTPHRAGRVLGQLGQAIELELHCRRCGAKIMYETDDLPAGYRVYRVHIAGVDNPALPAEFRPQPLLRMEEEVMVLATSAQEAHEQADAVTSLRFTGHLVHHHIDGQLHLNERF